MLKMLLIGKYLEKHYLGKMFGYPIEKKNS